MYRFLLRPRWIAFTLAVVVAIVVMINLGFWQLRRLDERREFNATVEDAHRPTSGRPRRVGPSRRRGRRRRARRRRVATGRGVRSATSTTRSCASSTAPRAVAPATTSSPRCASTTGASCSSPAGSCPSDAEAPPAPAGEVTVEGRLRRSQVRRTGALSDPAHGDAHRGAAGRHPPPRSATSRRRRADVHRADGVASRRVGRSSRSRSPSRSSDEGPHLSYAVQWFLFSAIAVIGWILAVGRSRRVRP